LLQHDVKKRFERERPNQEKQRDQYVVQLLETDIKRRLYGEVERQ